MDLHEYPRPANDTGIGIHWSAGYAAAIGLARIRDVWLPELRSLGVKWVKIFNHDGAQDFAELLLAEGFMPILRLYRPHPNPGRLSVRELVSVDEFVRIGVRYFELNNEPDQDSQWQGGRVPANGLDIVVEDTITDVEAVLERGGMPAIPAVSSGSKWDLVGRMVEAGRKDLFEGPVWQAVHNYSRNRPLDYPYDIGNQEGAPVTERFYYAVANESLPFPPWHGRTLAEINQLRREYASPGVTISDDHASWLAYEFHNERNLRHLGRSLPILSTENGYLVSENTDPRYPATTPELHMAQTLEACRIMMGVSQRYQNAPDYYFCSAFTLIANVLLGSPSSWWEGQAWYSRQWRGGMLPIVKALKAEPKVLRPQLAKPTVERVTISGTLLSLGTALTGNNRRPTVVLDRNGDEYAKITIDNANQYRFPDLTPGVYTVRVEGTDLVEAITLHPGDHDRVLNLDMATLNQDVGRSTLSGTVRGGADAVVMLVRVDDGEEWVTMARADGSFRFVDLPPGIYNTRVHPKGSHEHGIVLNGQDNKEVDLAVWGWGYTVHQDPFKKERDQISPIIEYVPLDTGFASGLDPELNNARDDFGEDDEISTLSSRATVIRCSVEGHKNVWVCAEAGDWQSPAVETGSAPQYGEFAAVLDLLSHRTATYNQTYLVVAEGVVNEQGLPVPLEATVTLKPGHRPTVRFIHQETHQTTIPQRAQIVGRIYGVPAHKEMQVTLFDERAQQQQQSVRKDGTFHFQNLTAGRYTVVVDGHETEAFVRDIALDGTNEVTVEMVLASERSVESHENRRRSRIVGLVPLASGRTAYLADAMGNEQSQIVGADETVRFENLPAGSYTLRCDGGYVEAGLVVDGYAGLEVYFSTLVSQWKAEVNAAGSMPGFSAVRVEVRGRDGHTVYLTDDEQKSIQSMTGSRPDLGEYALEFSPLEPGQYIIQPSELDVQAVVELTGLEAVWVSFWEQKVPRNPHAVLPLSEEGADDENESPKGERPSIRPMQELSDLQELLSRLEPDVYEPAWQTPDLVEADMQIPEQDSPGLTLAERTAADVNAHAENTFIEQTVVEQTPDAQQKLVEQMKPGLDDDLYSNLQSGLWSQEPQTTESESPMNHDEVERSDGMQGEVTSPPLGSSLSPSDYPLEYDGAPNAPVNSSSSDENRASQQNPPPSLADSATTAANEAEKAIAEYLFIEGSTDANLKKTIESLIAVLRYVAANQPQIGSSIEMARHAERVVVMGKVSQQILDELNAAGIPVEQASSSLIEAYRYIEER